MKRRIVLISLLYSTIGLLGMKWSPQDRVVYWPKNWRQQDQILAEQWREHYRIAQVFENETAGFEFVA